MLYHVLQTHSLPKSQRYLKLAHTSAKSLLHLEYLAGLHETTVLLYIKRWQRVQTKSGPLLIS